MKLPLLQTVALAVLLALVPLPALAARNLTLCLDGALVEQQESARQGYVELALPAVAVAESLRIRPGKGVVISRVLTVPREPSRSIAKELATLTEREEQLHDRLKALSVREEIFKAAARSQSAKAPRRSRTNPEPLATIRQGTDYAIAQLEAVYQSKRKAEKELARIAERRSRLQKEEAVGGLVAKVWLTPANGKIIASWQQPDRLWTPAYQLRVNGPAEAQLALYATGVNPGRGEKVMLQLSRLQAGSTAALAYAGESVPVQNIPLKIVSPQGGATQSQLVLTVVNTSGTSLPAGDTACFQNGVYMGKGMFPGADAGKTAEIICNGR